MMMMYWIVLLITWISHPCIWSWANVIKIYNFAISHILWMYFKAHCDASLIPYMAGYPGILPLTIFKWHLFCYMHAWSLSVIIHSPVNFSCRVQMHKQSWTLRKADHANGMMVQPDFTQYHDKNQDFARKTATSVMCIVNVLLFNLVHLYVPNILYIPFLWLILHA